MRLSVDLILYVICCGQGQALSLRIVRNYRFTFLRLAKDYKGSNPITIHKK